MPPCPLPGGYAGGQPWQALADARGRIAEDVLQAEAARRGLSLLEAQTQVCDAGFLPTRYARNASMLSPAEQGQLLRGHVLLVGLGGLGGHILDMLARMGVGHIVGVDGDIFEESNCNRQLLASCRTLGQGKAQAAAAHAAAVNPAIRFTPVPQFVRGEGFAPLAAQAEVVVDALGGLTHRRALHRAAADAGKPVVCAGIAGLTGWVSVVSPGGADPLFWMEQGETGGESAEERLGNLAPAAAMAASLQAAEVLKILTRRKFLQGVLFFDMEDSKIEKIKL